MGRLSQLETFVAIVDAGSLAGAARRLRRSPPVVTRHLSELETMVGVVLVERTTRKCQPTEAGRRLAEQARNLLSSYSDAISDASGEATEPKGSLRITAPFVFGRDHVAPLIADFLEAYPSITADIHLADRVMDIHDENFDLAVRIGEVTDTSLVARRVGQVRRLFVASPAYIETHGLPTRPDDLHLHEIVQQTNHGIARPWAMLDRAGRPLAIDVRSRFTVNQADAALAEARNGRGIVAALSYQVDADLRDRRLVRLLREFEPEPLPVSLAWPQSRRLVRRVRLLVNYLEQNLAHLSLLHSDD